MIEYINEIKLYLEFSVLIITIFCYSVKVYTKITFLSESVFKIANSINDLREDFHQTINDLKSEFNELQINTYKEIARLNCCFKRKKDNKH